MSKSPQQLIGEFDRLLADMMRAWSEVSDIMKKAAEPEEPAFVMPKDRAELLVTLDCPEQVDFAVNFACGLLEEFRNAYLGRSSSNATYFIQLVRERYGK